MYKSNRLSYDFPRPEERLNASQETLLLVTLPLFSQPRSVAELWQGVGGLMPGGNFFFYSFYLIFYFLALRGIY